MTTKPSITCDFCGKELAVDSPYPHNYGLRLECRDYGYNTSGREFMLAMYPLLDSPKDFCGHKCLAEWINKRI